MNLDSLLALVKHDLSAFREIQPKLESSNLSDTELHEIYLAIVKANPSAIELVPESRQDEEIFIALIMHEESKNHIDEIFRHYIKEANLTYKLLIAACTQDLKLLMETQNNWEYISKQFKLTPQQTHTSLCADVAKNNWRAIRFYPSTLDNTVREATQKCKIAVSKDWRDIVYVPDYLLEDEFFHPSILKAQEAITQGELKPTLFTSQKILTETCCLAAIALDADNFSNIPSILRTKNICGELIKDAPHKLRYFAKPEDRLGLSPNEYENLCREAVETYGYRALNYIPSKMRTYDLCLIAINKDIETLQSLKFSDERKGLTENEYKDICLIAIKKYGEKAFYDIDPEVRTYDFYVAALNNHLETLQFLKKNQLESKLTANEYANILTLAGDKYGFEAIAEYILPEMRTINLWLAAVNANVSELNFLKESEKLTQDDYKIILLAALKKHGNVVLNYLTPEMLTYEVCLAAINNDIDALYKISDPQNRIALKSGEYAALCAAAKNKYGVQKTFQFFSPEMRTYANCLELIKNDESALRFFTKPEDQKGLNPGEYDKLCLEAINIHGYSALFYIPVEHLTYDKSFTALKKSIHTIHYLCKPERQTALQSGEFTTLCLEAIEIYGYSALNFITPEMRSYEVCLAAINKEVWALSSIKNPKDRIALKPDEYVAIFRAAKEKYGIQATFRLLSSELKTYNLSLEAVTNQESALGSLEKLEDREGLKPGEYNTLCLEAIKIHGTRVLRYIPHADWTYDLCLAAIAKDVRWLEELHLNRDQTKLTPDEYTKIYLEASKLYGSSALGYFPQEMRTYDTYLAATLEDVATLKLLEKPENRTTLKPDEYHNLCREAIKTHGSSALFYILPEMRTYDLCVEAINKDSNSLHLIFDQEVQKNLKDSEYLALCNMAKDRHGIKKTFQYLPPEMKTYDVCLAAEIEDVDVIKYLKTPNDRKLLAAKEYSDLCFKVIKKQFTQKIAPNLSDDKLTNFIARYEAINKFNNYQMNDISTFFSKNNTVIANIYKLLDEKTFLLMEKFLVTSADKLNRFFTELKNLSSNKFDGSSKNISRLFDNIDYKNANKKAAHLKHYLLLSSDDKKTINILLDDSTVNINTIPQAMRELLVNKFYDYLQLPRKKEKDVLDLLSYEQLADLNSLFESLKKDPENDKSKIFFSMLKIYLGNIPFQNLHQPDEMRKKGGDYMVKMAEHNKKLREKISAAGVDITKAFSYKKQISLKFDEHHKQKIMTLLTEIYKKIKQSIIEKKPEAINKNVKNFLLQIEKGKDDLNTKLLRILNPSNLTVLKKIVDTGLPDIKPEYIELLNLTKEIKTEVLTNYQPREFRIQMWDKSKIETFFLGDYLSCCLATTGTMSTEYSPRVFDDAFLMPVIVDETTQKPVCGAWLFFGQATESPNPEKKLDVVANFFEINAGIAENKQLMNFLLVNLLNYIGEFSESINADEFIMSPLTYGIIPDFNNFGSFTPTTNRKVEKVGGYFGSRYYLNATSVNNFYLYDQKNFTEQMQNLIQLEPKISGYASRMTLGFSSKPKPGSEKVEQAMEKQEDRILKK